MSSRYAHISSGKGVEIHPTAFIGQNVKIYDGVKIGPHSYIGDNCTLGEPLQAYYQNPDYMHPDTLIGANALIRSNTVVYAGNSIGEHFACGHHVTIRENNQIGHHVSFGTLSDIQGESKFGNYVRLHSNVHICQFSQLHDFVMIYPFVVLTNDKFPPTHLVQGPSIGEYSQIGVHSVIHAGIIIQDNCLVGSMSNVNINLPAFSFFVGNPGSIKGDVRTMKDDQGENLYPWPYRFNRGMPWQELGYDQWKNASS